MSSFDHEDTLRENATSANSCTFKRACYKIRNACTASLLANSAIFLSTALTGGISFGVATVLITVVPVNTCIVKVISNNEKY